MEKQGQRLASELRTAVEKAEQREAEITALFEASRSILEYRHFHEAAQAIFNSAKKVIGATAGYIALLSQDGIENEVLFLDSGGLPCRVDPSLPMPIRGLRALAYQIGKTVFYNDFASSEYAALLPPGHVPLANALFSPMVIEGMVVGLLGLANKPGGFTENDARLAGTFAEFAAIALVNKRGEEERERLVEKLSRQAADMEAANAELETRAEKLAAQNEELNMLARKLEEEWGRWQGLVQASPLPIISIDGAAKVTNWNPAAEAMFGWRAGEVLGRRLPIIPPEEEKAFSGLLKAVFQGKSVSGQEVRRQCRDGSIIDVSLSTSLIYGQRGKIIGAIGIFEDISGRKRFQEALLHERDKLTALLDSMEDGVYIVNRNYDIEYVNPALTKVFGQPGGRKCYEYFHDRREFCPWCKNPEVLAGKTVRWEWYSFKNQRTYDLLDTPLRNPDGTVSKLEIFRDVTERKQAETQIRRQNLLLNGINRIFKEALTCETEEILGKTCLAVAEELTGSNFGFIGELNEAGLMDTIALSNPGWAACSLAAGEAALLLRNMKPRGLFGKVITEGNSLIANEPVSHPDSIGIPEGHPPLTAFLGVPLQSGGRTTGMIGLGNKEGGYDQDDREAMETLAGAVVEVFLRIRAEQALKQAHDELESRVQERTAELQLLATRLINAQEQERNWISRELHDSLGQALIFLKYQVSSLEEKILANQPELCQDCGQLLDSLDDLIGKIRRVSRDLSPAAVRELGVSGALRFLLEQFGKHATVRPYAIDIEKIDGLFSPAIEINIYRIFQEALTNVAKHSRAARVSVTVRKKPDEVFFQIEDDGQGFDPDQVLARPLNEKGLGLAAMQERVRLAGGAMEIWSGKGQGTRISFTIPLGR